MDKPIITINLNKYLYDFLLHEFDADNSGRIILNCRSDIGLFIDSMWEISDRPVKPVKMENPVTLILPIRSQDVYVKRNKFICVPVWKETQIQEYIEAEFRLRVRDFFTIGYEKKFKQKDIIEAFLTAYGMKNNSINFDQIKKIDYRNRKKLKNIVKIEIQNSIN
jgi:hypothetical protein